MFMEGKRMNRVLQQERCGILLRLTMDDDQVPSTVPVTVAKLLSEFADVFAIPSTLPPKREHDHRITLDPNASPVNVRPYRYPHFQKAEIDKVVSELKSTGLIRPSSSPYSSPVLLVRKKDGSWRMRVDH